MTAAGAILAGGEASRYDGRAKGTMRVGGRRLVDRVLAALTDTGAAPVMLISGRSDAAGWLPGIPVHADVHPGLGSLGGLHTALSAAAAAGASGVYVVAWDMPFVTAAMLVQLRSAARDAVAAVPVHPDGTPEPLCGWYTVGCLTAADRLLIGGERRAAALADRVAAARIPAAALGNPALLFTNINTPNDLVRARHRHRDSSRAAGLA